MKKDKNNLEKIKKENEKLEYEFWKEFYEIKDKLENSKKKL